MIFSLVVICAGHVRGFLLSARRRRCCHLNGLGDHWSARISEDIYVQGCEVVHGLVVVRSDASQSVPCKGVEISTGLGLGLAVRGIYIVTFPADQKHIQASQRSHSDTNPRFRQKKEIASTSKHEILHPYCKRYRLLSSRVIPTFHSSPLFLTSASPAAPSPKTSNPHAPTQPQLAPL